MVRPSGPAACRVESVTFDSESFGDFREIGGHVGNEALRGVLFCGGVSSSTVLQEKKVCRLQEKVTLRERNILLPRE